MNPSPTTADFPKRPVLGAAGASGATNEPDDLRAMLRGESPYGPPRAKKPFPLSARRIHPSDFDPRPPFPWYLRHTYLNLLVMFVIAGIALRLVNQVLPGTAWDLIAFVAVFFLQGWLWDILRHRHCARHGNPDAPYPQKERYILDENRNPVVEHDAAKWRQWYTTASSLVAEDRIGPSTIATYFLAIDHDFFGLGQPVLWETMVFDGPLDQSCDRCAGSWQQAEAMHARMVRRVTGSPDFCHAINPQTA